MFHEYSSVLLILALVVTTAMVARWLADRFRQPSVLGELMLGVLIGNVGLWLGYPLFSLIMHLESADALFGDGMLAEQEAVAKPATTSLNSELPESLLAAITGKEGIGYLAMVHALWVLANLGVLLLLFQAGLESSVDKMRRVGGQAIGVAVIGIAAPFALALLVCYLLHPAMTVAGHLFLAAALSATSVGITARVFADMNEQNSQEAEVVLGAAVIDDVLGLILLAVVAGIASTGSVDPVVLVGITIAAVTFFAVVLTVGERVVGWGAYRFQKLDGQNAKLLYPLAVALVMAWIADRIHLAPIIGAFAAGLILSERQFVFSASQSTLREQVAPLERFLAPIFFLFIGMQVNLAYFVDLKTLLLAAGFTTVAIFGKAVAGLAARSELDRLSIGIAMLPRGEVGLIFLSVGRSLGVVSQQLFAALVVTIVITTLITPPAMKWSLSRHVKTIDA